MVEGNLGGDQAADLPLGWNGSGSSGVLALASGTTDAHPEVDRTAIANESGRCVQLGVEESRKKRRCKENRGQDFELSFMDAMRMAPDLRDDILNQVGETEPGMISSSSEEDEQEAQTLVMEMGGDQSRKPPAEERQAWREAGQEINLSTAASPPPPVHADEFTLGSAASPPPPAEPDVHHRTSSEDLPHRHVIANEGGHPQLISLPCMVSSRADPEDGAFDIHEWQRDESDMGAMTPSGKYNGYATMSFRGDAKAKHRQGDRDTALAHGPALLLASAPRPDGPPAEHSTAAHPKTLKEMTDDGSVGGGRVEGGGGASNALENFGEETEDRQRRVGDLISHFNSVEAAYQRSRDIRAPKRLHGVSITFANGVAKTVAAEPVNISIARDSDTESCASDLSAPRTALSDEPASSDDMASHQGSPVYSPSDDSRCEAQLSPRPAACSSQAEHGAAEVETAIAEDTEQHGASEHGTFQIGPLQPEPKLPELAKIYEQDWTAQFFSLSDQTPAKKPRVQEAQVGDESCEAASGNDESPSGEAGDESADDGAREVVADEAERIEELEELIQLEQIGEAVGWPPGMNAMLARRAVHEWNANRGPPTKRAKGGQHERENIGGSAPVIVSANVAPFVQVAPLNPFPAPEHPLRDAMHLFGRYHDLRQSGMVIWCRSCGRFGEERLQKDRGLGGDCLVVTKGPKYRAHTQLNLLRAGFHPRTKAPLPPDVAFVR